MAVLLEAISVVIRRDAIERKFAGGWHAFRSAVPNRTFCTDGELARVGFMTPDDARRYVERLEAAGLNFLKNDQAVDVAVVDQNAGPTTKCGWLQFTDVLGYDGKGSVFACRLTPADGSAFDGGPEGIDVVVPQGWTFEGSLSQKPRFVPTEEMQKRLKFLRRQNGVEVFLDSETGKEVYIGRCDGRS